MTAVVAAPNPKLLRVAERLAAKLYSGKWVAVASGEKRPSTEAAGNRRGDPQADAEGAV